METSEIKDFYNTNLQKIDIPYEQQRWFKSPQTKAGYDNTKSALTTYALPHIGDAVDVLEFGPGPGTWTKCLLKKAPHAHYDLVDISEEMLKQASFALSDYTNIQYITSDILDFKPKKQYDFFLSSRIIEYVPQKDRAIQTIAQSLKSGAYGYLVTKTPQYKRIFGKPISSPMHRHQVSPSVLTKLLTQNGCVVCKTIHVTCVFPLAHSGVLDRLLTKLCRLLPFTLSLPVSESYAIVFQKK